MVLRTGSRALSSDWVHTPVAISLHLREIWLVFESLAFDRPHSFLRVQLVLLPTRVRETFELHQLKSAPSQLLPVSFRI